MVANLRKLRKHSGLSQQKLADKVGMTQQTINNYENHSIEPDIRGLMILADFFHTTVDYLVGHTPEGEPEPDWPYLNESEQALIRKFRAMSEKKRKSILEVMDNYLETK